MKMSWGEEEWILSDTFRFAPETGEYTHIIIWLWDCCFENKLLIGLNALAPA